MKEELTGFWRKFCKDSEDPLKKQCLEDLFEAFKTKTFEVFKVKEAFQTENQASNVNSMHGGLNLLPSSSSNVHNKHM